MKLPPIVMASNVDTWGLKQDTNRDVHRFDILVTHHKPKPDYLTLVFEKTNTEANLIMSWDKDLAKLQINF
jgi:hypothetical protein